MPEEKKDKKIEEKKSNQAKDLKVNDEKKTAQEKEAAKSTPAKDASVKRGEHQKKGVAGPKEGKSLYAKNRGAKKRQFGRKEEKKEFEQKIVDLARVTRVMAGGKRMSFRACVAIGDFKGRVAVGLAKGPDVTIAISKAVAQAKKDMITIPLTKENSILHEIRQKEGAAKILFKPAKVGHGVMAGGVVKIILELAGIKNITSKILGTSNKVNNAKCTIEALRTLQS